MTFRSLILHTLYSASLVTLCHCEKQEPATITPSETTLTKYTFSEPHMATTVSLVLYTSDQNNAKKISEQCFQQVHDLNAIFSSYLPNSELSILSNKKINTPHKVSDHLFNVINHAQILSQKTQGSFDITLGQVTKKWKQPSSLIPTKTNFHDLILDTQHKTITFKKTLKLDLGGIAKGYIADQLMLTLQKANIKHSAVIIGGETVLADAPPNKEGWKIGIENPEQQIIGSLTLSNTALSTSGDSYQFIEHKGIRVSHLIDPHTQSSKTNRLNVTVIAPTAMQADSWATALRILPTKESLILTDQEPLIHALFLPYKESAIRSEQFPVITPL